MNSPKKKSDVDDILIAYTNKTSKLTGNANIKDIQWYMLDKQRYLPLTVANMIAVRTLLYPLTLVRTRLQVQTRKSIYSGTFNALGTVLKYEGIGGLYKGYFINFLQFAPHVLYIATYEKVRENMSMFTNNFYAMAFAGGAAGSLVAQIFSVPFDIVTQHLMLVGQKSGSSSSSTHRSNAGVNVKPSVGLSSSSINSMSSANDKMSSAKEIERIQVPNSVKNKSSLAIAKYIIKEIYKNESLKGFYRGYFLSTFQVSLNSSLWWPFYYFYQNQLTPFLPNEFPTLALQCCCGPLGSLSANFITNPIDVMRTRMQVTKNRESALNCLKTLWREDGYRLFWKGLTARLSYSCFYSFFIIFGYESVKKYSLKEEYQRILYPIE